MTEARLEMSSDTSHKKLTKWTILGYGLGHVCNDICASMWFTYLLLFLQKVYSQGSTAELCKDCIGRCWV